MGSSDGNLIVCSDDGAGHIGKYTLAGDPTWTRDFGAGNYAIALCKDKIERFWVLVRGVDNKVLWFGDDGTKKLDVPTPDYLVSAFANPAGGISLLSGGNGVSYVTMVSVSVSRLCLGVQCENRRCGPTHRAGRRPHGSAGNGRRQ